MTVEIVIEGRGWTRFFLKKKIRRDLPSSFEELAQARRIFILKKLFSGADETAGRLAALQAVIDVPRWAFNALDADQIGQLLDAAPWLSLDASPKPPIRYFDHGGRRFWLPDDYFMNGSCLEFAIADEAFGRFIETGESKHLNLLCATICREARPEEEYLRTGDRRRPLASRAEAESIAAARLATLPHEIGMAISLYWAGVKKFVNGSYGKTLFEQPEKDENGNPVAPEPSEIPSLGWWGLYFDLAENGPFGQLEAVHRHSFHEVCLYLVRKKKIEDAARMAQRMQASDFGKGE